MPEGLEAEIWRRACEPLIGRTITAAAVDDRVVPEGFAMIVVGATITGVRRVGKVVLLDTTVLPIGLHFGMTGRLVIDGVAPIAQLSYSSGRDDLAWDRLVLFTGHAPPGATPALRMNDPRRLGHVSLDPDLTRLGVDIEAVSAATLRQALARRTIALKSALLDQHVVAGLGNLLVDEVLWWAGLDPHRGADTLDDSDISRLAGVIRRRLPIMLRRGGSSTGTLSPAVRATCPPCPRDGTPLRRDTIGARTTVWCSIHQR